MPIATASKSRLLVIDDEPGNIRSLSTQDKVAYTHMTQTKKEVHR